MNIEHLPTKNERYEDFVKHQIRDGYNYLEIAECDICGYLEYKSASKREQKGYNVEILQQTECKKCVEIVMRNPEIYNWILTVIWKTLRDLPSHYHAEGVK